MSTPHLFVVKMSRHMTLKRRWIASCEAVGRWMPFKSDRHLQQHVLEVPDVSQLAPARPSHDFLDTKCNLVLGFLKVDKFEIPTFTFSENGFSSNGFSSCQNPHLTCDSHFSWLSVLWPMPRQCAVR